MQTPNTAGLLVEPDIIGRFSGLKVVVTGAGSGIGLATALRIAREGGHVVATDINLHSLQSLCEQNPTLALTAVAGDVTNSDHLAEIVVACEGKLDGLVNNAGINDGFILLDEASDAHWEHILEINLTAPFKVTRALIPLLQQSAQAAIVNVGSVAGLRGAASGIAYTTTKHALVGLTRGTSFQYENIRCNLIAPAGVVTSINAEPQSVRGAERILATINKITPPPAQPEQIAAFITFLLSKDASNIDGAILPCDGGFSAI
jgi:NAD(P)-dependent dehydrogenase (short-subunit alcohol dehydrogenase family)